MFTLEAINYSYPGQGAAIRNLSATLPDGVTLLAGPNAGGKTTLLRILAGLITPQSGAVRIGGSETAASADELRRLGRMVMQDADPQILGSYVGEDVMLGQSSSSLGGGFSAKAGELAGYFGLKAYWDEPVEVLSHGQKRKLCLLHALLAGPRALLLDEPFAGLDYPSAKELRRFIAEHRGSGMAQIVSVHDLEPVFDLADWMIVVDSGRVVAEGKPETLRSELERWSVRPPGGGWDN